MTRASPTNQVYPLTRNKSPKAQKQNANRLINKQLAFYKVPRAGVEPARVAPLVFETSASTDSAIWASKAVQSYNYFPN